MAKRLHISIIFVSLIIWEPKRRRSRGMKKFEYLWIEVCYFIFESPRIQNIFKKLLVSINIFKHMKYKI